MTHPTATPDLSRELERLWPNKKFPWQENELYVPPPEPTPHNTIWGRFKEWFK